MSVIVSEVYDALLSAGAPEAQARAAAAAIPIQDNVATKEDSRPAARAKAGHRSLRKLRETAQRQRQAASGAQDHSAMRSFAARDGEQRHRNLDVESCLPSHLHQGPTGRFGFLRGADAPRVGHGSPVRPHVAKRRSAGAILPPARSRRAVGSRVAGHQETRARRAATRRPTPYRTPNQQTLRRSTLSLSRRTEASGQDRVSRRRLRRATARPFPGPTPPRARQWQRATTAS